MLVVKPCSLLINLDKCSHLMEVFYSLETFLQYSVTMKKKKKIENELMGAFTNTHVRSQLPLVRQQWTAVSSLLGLTRKAVVIEKVVF